MMKKSLLFVGILSFSILSSYAQLGDKEKDKKQEVLGAITPAKQTYTKEMILGNILKGALEQMHLTKKIVDDDLSEKAFKLFLERIDYGKQFLLKEDVEKLEKYKDKLDDELRNGNLAIIDDSTAILNKRIPEIKKYVMDILKKPFKLNEKETIETDPKKREFFSKLGDLKDFWRRQLKLEILSRYLDMKEGEINSEDSKKKNKNKKTEKKDYKKMSDAELEKEAREKVQKSYEKIFKRMAEERKNDNLDKFYNSITRVYDPHTHYFIPEEKEDFDIDMTGKLEGIGALLREDGQYIKVEKIIPGSASWKGKKLKEEDTILAVGQGDEDPIDIVDMSLRDAVKLIRGPKGTTVKLTVKKPDGSTDIIAIVREEVIIEESYAKSSVLEHKDLGGKVGYIYVPKFYRDFSNSKGRNCSDDVKTELEKLKKQNVEGVILDLRNNGGGALEDARLMSGLFIKDGPIVLVKSSSGETEELRDDDKTITFEKPLIVLVNKFSASASEIVAAAMQDYKRAVIVGAEHTHGKGTVQAVIDLDGYVGTMARMYSPLGALKITIQMFYRVNGASTQFKGVTPDIILPDPYSYLDSGERSMDYAIPYSEVKASKYNKWDKYSYKVDVLAKNSEKRVKNSEGFKKIINSGEYYSKRKDQTIRSLNAQDALEERKEIKKKVEEFKNDTINEKIIVTSDVKHKDEAAEERWKDFSEGLQKDPTIEESLYIMKDILKTTKM